MSTTHHTPIATGAAANTAIVNSPLGELDAAIVAVDLTEGGNIDGVLTVGETAPTAGVAASFGGAIEVTDGSGGVVRSFSSDWESQNDTYSIALQHTISSNADNYWFKIATVNLTGAFDAVVLNMVVSASYNAFANARINAMMRNGSSAYSRCAVSLVDLRGTLVTNGTSVVDGIDGVRLVHTTESTLASQFDIWLRLAGGNTTTFDIRSNVVLTSVGTDSTVIHSTSTAQASAPTGAGTANYLESTI